MKQFSRRGLLSALLAAFSLTGGWAGAAAPEEGLEIQATGKVTSVGEKGAFTLHAQGRDLKVSLDQEELKLKEGEFVRVWGELVGGDRIVASEVKRVPADLDDQNLRKLSGTIRTLDRENKQFSLKTAAGTVTIAWDPNTDFSRDGKDANAKSLREGDRVRVVGRAGAREPLLADRVLIGAGGAASGWSEEAVGKIRSVDVDAAEVEVNFDGETWVVRLKNATLRRSGKSIDLDHLRSGEQVRVTGTPRGAKTLDAETLTVVRVAQEQRDERDPVKSVLELFQKEQEQRRRNRCSSCNGTGRHWVCNGSGRTLTGSKDLGCNGTGRCPFCLGRGHR